jgi:hypothetical protein
MKETKTMSTKMTMPKKDAEDTPATAAVGQGRVTMERYRLQVDRQTKTSYATHDAAETAGAAIKKAHPLVQVTIYDAKESAITVL